MSGIDFLADTNAILYFLSGNECMRPFISSGFAYSVISEMELLSYPKITAEEECRIKGFLSGSFPVGISDGIKNETIRLRRKYNLKLPDAIIAASAMNQGLPLITADMGFQKIGELKLERIVPKVLS